MSKFAVIETGGKQYKVAEGDVLSIEKLPGEHKDGDKITFDRVLLVADDKDTKVGTPYVSGAKVEAVFKEDGRGKKLHIIKFKAKSNYSKKIGHRQPYTKVAISSIT
jgi:large subunit ribosomal protein L21